MAAILYFMYIPILNRWSWIDKFWPPFLILNVFKYLIGLSDTEMDLAPFSYVEKEVDYDIFLSTNASCFPFLSKLDLHKKIGRYGIVQMNSIS